MRPSRLLLGGLLGLALCVPPLGAGAPPSPLRLIPDPAVLVVQARGPRQLIEAVTSIDYLQQLQNLGPVREYFDSTNVRRFYQLVAWFERELGAPWPDLLDRLGGGGAALATARFGDNAPALFVLQGTDDKLMQKFVRLGLEIVEQEAERQGSKDRPVKYTYQGVEAVSVGKGFHAAVVQGALLLSNKKAPLARALDLAAGRGKKSLADDARLAEAARLLPKGPLASLWLNMDSVRKQPGADALYKTPRDPFQTVVLGGWADVATRAAYLAIGLHKEPNGLLATIRLPSGREGMGPDRAVSVPPDGEPGSRPLLEPKDVLVSTSFYWNLAAFWTDRVALFGEKNAKGFEQADESSGSLPLLSNFQLSKLLQQAGAYHRLVAVHQPKAGYKRQPKTTIPAFAYVLEMRKPDEFAKAMETILRGAALFGGTTQLGLKLVEEKHNGCNLVGYRFPEDRELKQDVNDLRFNFSPCFVRAGNQFVFCSTLELCRDVVDLLQAEAKSKALGEKATAQTRLYGRSGAALLKSFEDQLVTQTILDQAIPLEQARAQVQAFVDLLSKGGDLRQETTYAPKAFHYDIRLTFKK